FLDDWRRTPRSERLALVADPIADPGPDLTARRWAGLFAAAVVQLCWDDGQPWPEWTSRPEHRLEEPWFLEPAAPLRAWLLITTPPAFASRNVFCGEGALDRA